MKKQVNTNNTSKYMAISMGDTNSSSLKKTKTKESVRTIDLIIASITSFIIIILHDIDRLELKLGLIPVVILLLAHQEYCYRTKRIDNRVLIVINTISLICSVARIIIELMGGTVI